MKKFILPALLILAACTAKAQTKRIAHRSHSGSNQHFSLSGSDNFGNPPENRRYVSPIAEDSTKAANESAKRAGDGTRKKTSKRARKAKKPTSVE